MKDYLLKIFFFLIPLALFAVLSLMYAKQKHQFLPSSWYYYKEFNDAFQEKDIEVIALGNSKLLSAIDKIALEENNQHKVSVLGYSSANISVSKLTLESYISNCSKLPHVVLLEVSWFTFNTKRTHLHTIVGDLFIKDPKLWRHYFNYSENLGLDIKRAFKNTINRSFKIKNAKSNLSYAVKFKKSTPNEINYTFNVEDLEVVFPDHISGIDDSLLKDYNAIVTMCLENKIDLILFTAPEDETYSKYQSDIDEVKSIFHKSINNNENVYYLDYSFGGELWDKRYELWLKDSHHINNSVLFTKLLIKDIKANVENDVFR